MTITEYRGKGGQRSFHATGGPSKVRVDIERFPALCDRRTSHAFAASLMLVKSVEGQGEPFGPDSPLDREMTRIAEEAAETLMAVWLQIRWENERGNKLATVIMEKMREQAEHCARVRGGMTPSKARQQAKSDLHVLSSMLLCEAINTQP